MKKCFLQNAQPCSIQVYQDSQVCAVYLALCWQKPGVSSYIQKCKWHVTNRFEICTVYLPATNILCLVSSTLSIFCGKWERLNLWCWTMDLGGEQYVAQNAEGQFKMMPRICWLWDIHGQLCCVCVYPAAGLLCPPELQHSFCNMFVSLPDGSAGEAGFSGLSLLTGFEVQSWANMNNCLQIPVPPTLSFVFSDVLKFVLITLN